MGEIDGIAFVWRYLDLLITPSGEIENDIRAQKNRSTN